MCIDSLCFAGGALSDAHLASDEMGPSNSDTGSASSGAEGIGSLSDTESSATHAHSRAIANRHTGSFLLWSILLPVLAVIALGVYWYMRKRNWKAAVGGKPAIRSSTKSSKMPKVLKLEHSYSKLAVPKDAKMSSEHLDDAKLPAIEQDEGPQTPVGSQDGDRADVSDSAPGTPPKETELNTKPRFKPQSSSFTMEKMEVGGETAAK